MVRVDRHDGVVVGVEDGVDRVHDCAEGGVAGGTLTRGVRRSLVNCQHYDIRRAVGLVAIAEPVGHSIDLARNVAELEVRDIRRIHEGGVSSVVVPTSPTVTAPSCVSLSGCTGCRRSGPPSIGGRNLVPSRSDIAGGRVFIESPSAVTATVEFSHQKRSPVLAVFIGVTAVLVFGSADFVGGMAAKRISAVRVTAIGGLSGLATLLLGLRLGELTIQSVLTELYPAGAIIPAAVLLRERIAPVQNVRLVLAPVAAALLAVG